MAHSFIRNGSVLNIEFFDTIDLSSSNQIKSEFDNVISKDFVKVFLSAKNLKYIDSSGVAALLMIKRRCSQLECEFTISDISEVGYRVIELAKLTSLLPVKKVIEQDGESDKKTFEFSDSFLNSASVKSIQDTNDSSNQGDSETSLDSLNFKPGSFL
ncbi:STAS domain-containing protein [Polynucleobacter sp. AP-Elch-400A-B2]|uniref:STAS domain-containing protein n=1 Tax=Polynucleobacter sp. AP-Elch-400A-B2 TaxID=2576930 RepID=UPI001BFD854F|nr:STAS domain-containing protein [Polynucleobacter sp. AP-Elch-400A-B2]QWE25214.1 STAS domain-containing protein [Polynucleobacter sp. AP-Elch-400A-B2]